jgi:hypothetical protein
VKLQQAGAEHSRNAYRERTPMNRVQDVWPVPQGPHFSLSGSNRKGHDPLRRSPSVPAASLADELVYTEADRRADTWRSLKATLACFAVLSTIFLTLAGLLMALGLH